LKSATIAGTMKPTTTQATSKRWKLMLSGGVLCLLLGAGWWAANTAQGKPAEPGPGLMAAGFSAYVLARFLAWWTNG
jgi:hypothetical protein